MSTAFLANLPRAARESMVLLKNDGLLPFKSSPKTIAIIGPLADSIPVLEGNYNGTSSKYVTPVDVVVAVVGFTREIEGEEMMGRTLPDGFGGGDRTAIDLPKDEQALLEAVKATGKPLVVVLVNGSATSVNWAQQQANVILEARYPGEAGGTAIAETLAGVNNPAGRLPVTSIVQRFSRSPYCYGCPVWALPM